jgi:uncharacterized protein (TIGR02452 family)
VLDLAEEFKAKAGSGVLISEDAFCALAQGEHSLAAARKRIGHESSEAQASLFELLLTIYNKTVEDFCNPSSGGEVSPEIKARLQKAIEDYQRIQEEIAAREKKILDLEELVKVGGVKGMKAKAELAQLKSQDNTDQNRRAIRGAAAQRNAQKAVLRQSVGGPGANSAQADAIKARIAASIAERMEKLQEQEKARAEELAAQFEGAFEEEKAEEEPEVEEEEPEPEPVDNTAEEKALREQQEKEEQERLEAEEAERQRLAAEEEKKREEEQRAKAEEQRLIELKEQEERLERERLEAEEQARIAAEEAAERERKMAEAAAALEEAKRLEAERIAQLEAEAAAEAAAQAEREAALAAAEAERIAQLEAEAAAAESEAAAAAAAALEEAKKAEEERLAALAAEEEKKREEAAAALEEAKRAEAERIAAMEAEAAAAEAEAERIRQEEEAEREARPIRDFSAWNGCTDKEKMLEYEKRSRDFTFNPADWLNAFKLAKSQNNQEVVHSLRRVVLEGTLQAIDKGKYELATDAEPVPLDLDLKLVSESISEAIMYPKDQAWEKPTEVVKGTAHFLQGDCVDVAVWLQTTRGVNPVVVMSVDPKGNGGDWEKGSCAQEEEIWRRTTYSAVAGATQFLTLEGASVRYVPKVQLIRQGEQAGYAYSTAPVKLSFIAGCSIEKPQTQGMLNRYSEEDTLRYKATIRAMFGAALANGHDAIVLSSFGCGFNQGSPSIIAALFHDVLVTEYPKSFKHVTFAIQNDENGEANFENFQSAYINRAKALAKAKADRAARRKAQAAKK